MQGDNCARCTVIASLESAPPFQAPGQTFQSETSGFIFIAQHPDRPTVPYIACTIYTSRKLKELTQGSQPRQAAESVFSCLPLSSRRDSSYWSTTDRVIGVSHDMPRNVDDVTHRLRRCHSSLCKRKLFSPRERKPGK